MRWQAAATLLAFLDTDPEIEAVLSDPANKHKTERRKADAAGCFRHLRLLDVSIMRTLYRLLAAAVLNRPPREFAFFAQQTPEWRDLAMKFILNTNLSRKDPLEDTSNALKRAEGTVVDGSAIFDCLLAFRGLLAHGVLECCLLKRHRVEYGTRTKGEKKKLMAVPFIAKDVPAERNGMLYICKVLFVLFVIVISL